MALFDVGRGTWRMNFSMQWTARRESCVGDWGSALKPLKPTGVLWT